MYDEELIRRLLQGNKVIYPITRQEAVINLQKTIKEKMTIVSPTQPQVAIERQVWLDISESEEGGEQLTFGNVAQQNENDNGLTFGNEHPNEELTFGNENAEQSELTFGNNNSQVSDNLTFGTPHLNEVLTFGNESENIEQQN